MQPTTCSAGNGFAMRLCGVALGLVAFGLALMPALLAPAATAPGPSLKAEIDANYGKLPLSFEANRGQTDAQVKFLARGRGYALFLTATEAVLSLAKPQAHADAESSALSSRGAGGTVLAMQVSGANPESQVTGKDALPGRVNYFRGNDPAHWHTQIPTYAKVAYEGIYPGVDLVYYGNQGQLEYDFVVAPGTDPGVLKLVFRGADRIEINAAGELVLSTASGDIRLQAPVIYQETAGVRTSVAGGYVLEEPQRVSFAVAAYDTSRPLVIDPVLVYATYLGGSPNDFGDFGKGIAVDDRGNAYVTGQTYGHTLGQTDDFPTFNAEQPNFGGGVGDFVSDAFVTKLNPDGQLLYSTYLGGSGNDDGGGIAVDDRGNAYVTGNTDSRDFPRGEANPVQPELRGVGNAFVAKLTPDGSRLLYSTYLGGSGLDTGTGIAVDERGNAYVTGDTTSKDLRTTVNAVQRKHRGGDSDAFVAKLTPNGSRLLYFTYLGGKGDDLGKGIAVDDRGNAYVTGETESDNFRTFNAVQRKLAEEEDAFVAKLTPDGSRLLYSTYLGGNDEDSGGGIAVDERGNAYVTGHTFSDDLRTTVNAVQRKLAVGEEGEDAFVAKLTPNGRLLYFTYLGGSGVDRGNGIAVDDRGNAYVTGSTSSKNFPPGEANAVQSKFGGGVGIPPSDAFVAKLNPNGSRLLFSTYLGGSGDDEGNGIAVDDRGNAYVTGTTSSPDFPPVKAVQPAFQPALKGPSDAFVAKLAD